MNKLVPNVFIPMGHQRNLEAVMRGQSWTLCIARREEASPSRDSQIEQCRINIDALLDRWPLGYVREDISLVDAHQLAAEAHTRQLARLAMAPTELAA